MVFIEPVTASSRFSGIYEFYFDGVYLLSFRGCCAGTEIVDKIWL